MKPAVHRGSPPAEALMRAVLRAGRPLAPEYPLVFGSGAPGRIVAIADGDGAQVLSACAVLERELVTPAARVRAGLVGSVVTAPDHRGRGLASALLAASEESFRRAGCVLSILWADDPAFYERRGYAAFGSEIDFVVEPGSALRLPASDAIRLLSLADAPSVHALYAAHPARVERSEPETRALLATPAMTTLVLVRGGAVVAYACRGRGEDLANVVHEWAGAARDVLALVRRHVERAGEGLVLMAPNGRADLQEACAELGLPWAPGVLGMGKVLSLARAAELLGTLAPPVITCAASGDRLTVRGPAGELTLDATEALLALAPPRGDRSAVAALERATGACFPGLPLAPFLWGLDGI